MVNLFEKFPEIVFIDGTYNVHSHGMPVYCIMVEDGYGHGGVVFYAAPTEEDTRKMMQCFKETNPKWPIPGNTCILAGLVDGWLLIAM